MTNLEELKALLKETGDCRGAAAEAKSAGRMLAVQTMLLVEVETALFDLLHLYLTEKYQGEEPARVNMSDKVAHRLVGLLHTLGRDRSARQ